MKLLSHRINSSCVCVRVCVNAIDVHHNHQRSFKYQQGLIKLESVFNDLDIFVQRIRYLTCGFNTMKGPLFVSHTRKNVALSSLNMGYLMLTVYSFYRIIIPTIIIFLITSVIKHTFLHVVIKHSCFTVAVFFCQAILMKVIIQEGYS